MSLVNQMLRDLETRHAPERGGEAVLQDLPVNAAGTARAVTGAVYLVIGMVLAGLVILAGWYWLQQSEHPFPLSQDVSEPKGLVAPQPGTPVTEEGQSQPREIVVQQDLQESISEPIPEPIQVAPRPTPDEKPRQQTTVSMAVKEKPAGKLAEDTGPAVAAAPLQALSVKENKPDNAPVRDPKPVVKSPPPPVKPVLERIDRPLSREELAQSEFLKATNLITRGQVSSAHAAFAKALELHPRYVEAREVWVALLLRSGEIDRAERILQEGLALQPDAFSLARMLARLLAERGAVTQALGVLERTVPPVTADPDFYGLLAALYQRSEQHARAVAAYQRVLAAVPAKAVWWMGMGISLEKLQRREEAVQAYQRARSTGGLNAQLSGFVSDRLTILAGSEK